jgi:hypothetical protein
MWTSLTLGPVLTEVVDTREYSDDRHGVILSRWSVTLEQPMPAAYAAIRILLASVFGVMRARQRLSRVPSIENPAAI